MPKVESNTTVCFVHGHGATFRSDQKPSANSIKAAIKEQLPISPILLERVRQRAAAQLASQRVASRLLKRD